MSSLFYPYPSRVIFLFSNQSILCKQSLSYQLLEILSWQATFAPYRLKSARGPAEPGSGQKLGEREGAMAPRWDQVVLPVGRVYA